jgi:hypothetical protein
MLDRAPPIAEAFLRHFGAWFEAQRHTRHALRRQRIPPFLCESRSGAARATASDIR